MPSTLSPRVAALRHLIHEHILRRLNGKLDKLKPDDPKRVEESSSHRPDVWLASAAARAKQIQAVTHPLKATYPNAKIQASTSLYCRPDALPQHAYIGTHVLHDNFFDDCTGNSAALDVYGLLQCDYEDKTLLKLAQEHDPDLIAALSDDSQDAQEWVSLFAEVTQSKMDGVASHTYAKQLYWLVGINPTEDNDYCMLAPLYSSALAHAVYEVINEDRFGQANKEARLAMKANTLHHRPYRSYPNLALQKLGGTKPQNISQLNSQRRGINYLLPSLPPVWRDSELKTPLHLDSIFKEFNRQGTFWVRKIRIFLETNPASNIETRKNRDALLAGLLDELHTFSIQYQNLAPGWSADPTCELGRAQRLWLDPLRGLTDAEFRAEWLEADWPLQIGRDFANWLNSKLDGKLFMGDPEHEHWSRELRGDSAWIQALNQQRGVLEKSVKEKA